MPGTRHFPPCLENKSLNKCRVPGAGYPALLACLFLTQMPGTWHFSSCIVLLQKAKNLNKCRVPGAGYPPLLPCLFVNREDNSGCPAPGTPHFLPRLKSKRLNKCRVPGAGYPALLLCLSLTKMPGTRHFSFLYYPSSEGKKVENIRPLGPLTVDCRDCVDA